MHISRRAATVGAAVFTGLASFSAAASAGPATHNKVQVLRLHTKALSIVVNHAGHGDPAT